MDADEGARRARLQARARSVGALVEIPSTQPAPERRVDPVSTRGLGLVVDGLLDEDRDRR